ncbi:MAG: cysteine desulfurase IscS, partial [Spirosoma sp.]|nr:cysteine desulfurase IscS [Spirosoma sp.]
YITYLNPNADGLISADQLRNALKPDTVLATVMVANNETGVIQPINELAAVAHERGVLFHTDATQAVGKLPLSLRNSAINLLSLSGHKLYAPKGIGALIVRNKTNIIAQQDGGRHERGRRSGTLNVPGIVALGKAAELARQQMNTQMQHSSLLRDQLETGILSAVPNAFVNGSRTSRLPNTTNIAFAGVDGETLLASLNQIAVSNGSACNAASTAPSHVLKALGLSDDLAYSSVRFSVGRFTTPSEVETAIDHTIAVVSQLRGE